VSRETRGVAGAVALLVVEPAAPAGIVPRGSANENLPLFERHLSLPALAPSGIVAANVWGQAINPLYANMLLTYRAAFEDVYILDVPAPGTKIFAALPRRQAMTRDELIQHAREISRHRGFDYELGDAIAGFRNSDRETLRGGSVLRD
jgi:hypothetical protein